MRVKSSQGKTSWHPPRRVRSGSLLQLGHGDGALPDGGVWRQVLVEQLGRDKLTETHLESDMRLKECCKFKYFYLK